MQCSLKVWVPLPCPRLIVFSLSSVIVSLWVFVWVERWVAVCWCDSVRVCVGVPHLNLQHMYQVTLIIHSSIWVTLRSCQRNDTGDRSPPAPGNWPICALHISSPNFPCQSECVHNVWSEGSLGNSKWIGLLPVCCRSVPFKVSHFLLLHKR